jgi:hypothetical protein
MVTLAHKEYFTNIYKLECIWVFRKILTVNTNYFFKQFYQMAFIMDIQPVLEEKIKFL